MTPANSTNLVGFAEVMLTHPWALDDPIEIAQVTRAEHRWRLHAHARTPARSAVAELPEFLTHVVLRSTAKRPCHEYSHAGLHKRPFAAETI